jgi:hypothetical protein
MSTIPVATSYQYSRNSGPSSKLKNLGLHTMEQMPSIIRECVNTGAAGARARRFLGHHLLILSLLVLCAPAVLRPRALQDAPAHVDPNS